MQSRGTDPGKVCWLILWASDAVRSHDLQSTQEFIAEMLGVQRASVSGVANGLLQDGLISYRRGRIRIMTGPRFSTARANAIARCVQCGTAFSICRK